MIFLPERSNSSLINGRGLWLGLPVIAVALAVGLWMAWSRPRADDPHALALAVDEDLNAGQLDRAAEGLARLAELREAVPQDWSLKGQYALANNRLEEAYEHFGRIPDSHPLGALARFKQGHIELKRDRAHRAELLLLKAVELNPKLVEAHSDLIYIYGFQLRRQELRERYQLLSQARSLTFHDVYLWCLTRETNWDARDAAEILSKWVEADPQDKWSRIALADNLRGLNRLDEAERMLAPLPDRDPDALEARARLKIDQGRIDEVERMIGESDSNRPGWLKLRGKLATYRRDYPQAIQAYRQAHQLEPDNRDSLVGLAQALKAANDPEASNYGSLLNAHNELVKLIQSAQESKAESDPQQLKQLSEVCARLGRFPEAKAWLQLAINRNPLDSEAQTALFRLNEQERAAKAVGR